jgi:hypothetical protein
MTFYGKLDLFGEANWGGSHGLATGDGVGRDEWQPGWRQGGE